MTLSRLKLFESCNLNDLIFFRKSSQYNLSQIFKSRESDLSIDFKYVAFN